MIVSDASPLITFARVNRLELINRVLDTIIIPEAVEAELVTDFKPGSTAVQNAAWIKTQPVKNRAFLNQLPVVLGQGEREAIALAHERGALLLIDEKDGRDAAVVHNLRLLGSLTILRQAKESGLIPAIKPLLDQMIANDYRVSKGLYRHILTLVGEL